ncbi:beta-lactamase-like protein [Actinorhabdospora filicis]|uniref:Beta-lactamase-like protein n=1 Tax=Actinorhabdospora filicis TaxID=1785913 RepID=A0A9W6W8P2_9ACTN|nr:alkyl sulfatase dimerization domain-containing protein [Actinorhabdospora filicis]GLZ76686.1 beta-lactamase-like protein [Actinorhabdospora filicis]
MTSLDYADRTDSDDADRGFIAALTPGVVKAPDGRVIWDSDAYAFLEADCPPTAHPSLWRQARLCAKQGLYQVTERVYQVRGLDLSNITFVEGDTGVIVIDPLISCETAAAALGLYRAHRGDRPVTGVIYTHSHVDHFGGVMGVTDGNVPILAPVGFMEHAVAENVYAGVAMARRANLMYGVTLGPGPEGQLGMGLGLATSTGRVSLIPPTVDITHTGQTETVDGVRISFQLTPGTEAPAEMNFLFPDLRALCMAENATHTLHNVLTLRGAVVRDSRMWSRYLGEAIELFAGGYDVLFASHHWPTWDEERCETFLREQRDMYGYLHDQTLRLLNQGYTGVEIAEMFQLPEGLDTAWNTRGYYGSVSHNVKAVYQRYMGWFDGVPAHLWAHPTVESAKRYVDCLGGVPGVLGHARRYADEGDLRFAAQLLQQAVFAEPGSAEAKEALAGVYTKLGRGAENGTWRNFYLTGAKELRDGVDMVPFDLGGDMATALSVEQIFDSVAIRVDGVKAARETAVIDWTFTDLGEKVRTELSNGVLVQTPDPKRGEAGLRVTTTKLGLLGLLAGKREGVEFDGDASLIERLVGVIELPDPNFAIVTP